MNDKIMLCKIPRIFCIAICLRLVACDDVSKDEAQSDPKLFISTFNIQVLGKSKVGKKDIVDVLCKRWSVTKQFYSSRFIIVENGKIEKLDVVSVYERHDPYDDLEREPTVARFRRIDSKGEIREFTFIPIHVKPDDAVNEMNSLMDVCDEAERVFGENIILAGDFNADCSYVTISEWDDCKLKHDHSYKWLISDDEDTTTKKTDCAYDRIILRGDKIHQNSCCAKVHKFDLDLELEQELVEDVSDHYPVEFYIS